MTCESCEHRNQAEKMKTGRFCRLFASFFPCSPPADRPPLWAFKDLATWLLCKQPPLKIFGRRMIGTKANSNSRWVYSPKSKVQRVMSWEVEARHETQRRKTMSVSTTQRLWVNRRNMRPQSFFLFFGERRSSVFLQGSRVPRKRSQQKMSLNSPPSPGHSVWQKTRLEWWQRSLGGKGWVVSEAGEMEDAAPHLSIQKELLLRVQKKQLHALSISIPSWLTKANNPFLSVFQLPSLLAEASFGSWPADGFDVTMYEDAWCFMMIPSY